jgi:hypothetical protein
MEGSLLSGIDQPEAVSHGHGDVSVSHPACRSAALRIEIKEMMCEGQSNR